MYEQEFVFCYGLVLTTIKVASKSNRHISFAAAFAAGPRTEGTPYIRMIGMIVVFLGVVIGDLAFLGVAQAKYIKK